MLFPNHFAVRLCKNPIKDLWEVRVGKKRLPETWINNNWRDLSASGWQWKSITFVLLELATVSSQHRSKSENRFGTTFNRLIFFFIVQSLDLYRQKKPLPFAPFVVLVVVSTNFLSIFSTLMRSTRQEIWRLLLNYWPQYFICNLRIFLIWKSTLIF